MEESQRNHQEHPGRDSFPRAHHLQEHPQARSRLDAAHHHRKTRVWWSGEMWKEFLELNRKTTVGTSPCEWTAICLNTVQSHGLCCGQTWEIQDYFLTCGWEYCQGMGGVRLPSWWLWNGHVQHRWGKCVPFIRPGSRQLFVHGAPSVFFFIFCCEFIKRLEDKKKCLQDIDFKSEKYPGSMFLYRPNKILISIVLFMFRYGHYQWLDFSCMGSLRVIFTKKAVVAV